MKLPALSDLQFTLEEQAAIDRLMALVGKVNDREWHEKAPGCVLLTGLELYCSGKPHTTKRAFVVVPHFHRQDRSHNEVLRGEEWATTTPPIYPEADLSELQPDWD